MKRGIFLSGVILAITLTGCIDKDLGNIDNTLYYTPEYSLPIGSDSLYMQDMFEEYFGDLTFWPDSFLIPDTAFVFYYNSEFYTGVRTFEFTGEMPLDFTTFTKNIDYVTSLMLRTNCVNSIPAKISVQYYLQDENYNVIDSVYHNGPLVIPPAEIDSTGRVISTGEVWKSDVYVDTNTLSRLDEVYYLTSVSRIELSDFNISKIQYLADQNIWLQLGFRIKLDVPLHEI